MNAIILTYDEERHDYIVEDLDDDRHLVIKESQLQNLKIRLGKVREEEQRAGFLADWIVGPGRQAYAARRIGIPCHGSVTFMSTTRCITLTVLGRCLFSA